MLVTGDASNGVKVAEHEWLVLVRELLSRGCSLLFLSREDEESKGFGFKGCGRRIESGFVCSVEGVLLLFGGVLWSDKRHESVYRGGPNQPPHTHTCISIQSAHRNIQRQGRVPRRDQITIGITLARLKSAVKTTSRYPPPPPHRPPPTAH